MQKKTKKMSKFYNPFIKINQKGSIQTRSIMRKVK